jgi:hypothetical protein
VLELTNQYTANEFSNRVVFVGSLVHVGVAGDKPRDVFSTPYSRWHGTVSSGVEINATSYLNLFRGDWLTRTSVSSELIILVVAGLFYGFLLTALRPLLAVGLGAASAVAFGVAANLLVWKTQVWFPWLIVSAAQMPVAVGWSALTHTRRLNAANRALEHALTLADARERAAAALAAAAPRGMTITDLNPTSNNGNRRAELHSLGIPNYTLVRKIGEGAYGEVWLAKNIIGEYHAAKFVHRRAIMGPYDREFNGIRRFAPISRGHVGLVQVLHIGRNEAPEYIYYVMEIGDDEISGQDIDPATYSPRNLAKDLKKGRALSVAETLPICLQLAEALAYLHARDLIHRDIKPANIIFVQGMAKLADIGLVTQAVAEGRDVSYLGTEGYIPPEGPGTPAADVYSLGKVMYQMSTGLPVFRFPDLPSAVMEGTLDPAWLKLTAIIDRACEPLPEKRYHSAGELYLALAALAASQSRNQP